MTNETNSTHNVTVANPGLGVIKVSLNETDFIIVNDTVAFKITVVNKGSSDLHNVTVTEKYLPNELIYKNHSEQDLWHRSGDVFTYQGTLVKGANATFTIWFTANKNGTLVNNVTAKSNETNETNDTADVTVYKPNMTVEKITVNRTVTIGENVVFTIVVTNTGDCNLTDVFVEEKEHEGLEFVGYSDVEGKWTTKDNKIFYLEGKLSKVASFNITFKTTKLGNLTNVVVAGSNKTENKTTNNNTTVNPICDVVITKKVNASSIFVNETVEWTIVVVNKGLSVAENVIVNDTLPKGVIIIGELPNGGKQVGDNIIWELGNLDMNEPVTLKFVTKITVEGNNTNLVSVNSTTPDSNETNNHANNTTVANPICDLVITKEVNATSVFVNDSVEWTITVINKGPSTARNVVVNDTLPEGLVIIKATPTGGIRFINETRIWEIGDLEVGKPVSLVLVTKILVNGTFNNIVVANSTTPDSNESNNKANNTTVAKSFCDLEVTKTVNATNVNIGDYVEWIINVVNKGPSTAEDVVVKDTLPNGLKVITLPEDVKQEGNTLIWNIGTLAPNTTPLTKKIITQVLVDGNITNVVVVNSSTPDSNKTNNKANNTTHVDPICDLEIFKIVSSKKAYVGEELTWTIIVINHGPSAAKDVKVQEDIPGSLKFISYTATKGTYDKNSQIWTIGTMDNASSYTLTIVTKVLSVGNITNPVEVKTSTPENDTTNNKANDTAEAFELCDLVIKKSSDKKSYYVGDKMYWKIEVVNKGPSPARGVWVSDVLPSALKFLKFTASKGSYNDVTGRWSIGDLAKGEKVTLYIYCKVLSKGFLTNNANVTCSVNETDLSNNYDNATVKVIEKEHKKEKQNHTKKHSRSTPEPKHPVTMHSTGNPIAYLLIAIFAIFGSFWSRRKQE